MAIVSACTRGRMLTETSDWQSENASRSLCASLYATRGRKRGVF